MSLFYFMYLISFQFVPLPDEEVEEKLRREREIKSRWVEERHRLNRLLDDAFALSVSSFYSPGQQTMSPREGLSTRSAGTSGNIGHNETLLGYSLEPPPSKRRLFENEHSQSPTGNHTEGQQTQGLDDSTRQHRPKTAPHKSEATKPPPEGRNYRKVTPSENVPSIRPIKPRDVWNSMAETDVSEGFKVRIKEVCLIETQ